MATSLMLLQFAYFFAVYIGWTAVPFIQWRDVARGSFIPIMYAACVVTAIGYSFLSMIGMSSDCLASSDCQLATGVVELICDAVFTCGYSLMVVRRLSILIDDDYRKYLVLLVVVPIVYPSVDVLYGLAMFGYQFTWAPTVFFAFNMLIPLNCIAVDALLLYAMSRGAAAARFAPHHERRDRIFRWMLAASVMILASAVFSMFVPDLGLALIYIVCTWSLRIYGSLNRLIVHAFFGSHFTMSGMDKSPSPSQRSASHK